MGKWNLVLLVWFSALASTVTYFPMTPSVVIASTNIPTIEKLRDYLPPVGFCNLPGSEVISADGRYVLVDCYSAFDPRSGLYILDMSTKTRQFLRKDSHDVRQAALSANGQYIAVAQNNQIVRYDRTVVSLETSAITITVTTDGSLANGGSAEPEISEDGRYIAFVSNASNLAPDPNEQSDDRFNDIFLHDVQANTTVLVTKQIPNYGFIGAPSLSPDGFQVMYDYGLAGSYVYLFDARSNSTVNVSKNFNGTPGFGTDYALASNGAAAWRNSAPLTGVDTDGNGTCDRDCLYNTIYMRAPAIGNQSAIPVSIAANGGQENGGSSGTVISGDARFVAFYSGSTNLLPESGDCCGYIFLRDTQQGKTELISVAADGKAISADPLELSISQNGCAVGFNGIGGPYLRYRGGECSPPASAPNGPLVFIPGIAGSVLYDRDAGVERWPGVCNAQGPLSLFRKPQADIIPTDVVRKAKFCLFDLPSSGYDELLNFLRTAGGYVEYERYSEYLQTGCQPQYTKDGQKPTLFVFAYDWRRDNAESAQRLADYLGCVHKFYPNSPVTLLAHSMGGLIARRYILDTFPKTGVDTLITIGTPWLGAPKLPYVLETGLFVPSTTTGVARDVINSFPGSHQLMPSQLYFTLAAGKPNVVPFVENGWDINLSGNKTVPQLYTYADLVALANQRYGRSPDGNQAINPGDINQNFHGHSAKDSPGNSQDDWRADTTGIRYVHIVGVQSEPRTIGQVRATLQKICGTPPKPKDAFYCNPEDLKVFETEPTVGDATVPLLSAERPGYNSPGSTVCVFDPSSFGSSAVDDSLLDHLGLTQNPAVQQFVLKQIRMSQPCNVATALSRQATAATRSLYQVTVAGTASITVSDAEGRTTILPSAASEAIGSVNGVTLYPAGPAAATALLSYNTPYTVTWRAPTEGAFVRVKATDGATISRSITYLDLALPPQTLVQLRFNSNEPQTIQYDTDGDNVVDQEVVPSADRSGTGAQDNQAPLIDSKVVSANGQVHVMLSATDTESGVMRLAYSLDGHQYQIYDGPILLAKGATQLMAMADDGAGNRSFITVSLNQQSSYLPLVRK